jgi:hypothetical protein
MRATDAASTDRSLLTFLREYAKWVDEDGGEYSPFEHNAIKTIAQTLFMRTSSGWDAARASRYCLAHAERALNAFKHGLEPATTKANTEDRRAEAEAFKDAKRRGY